MTPDQLRNHGLLNGQSLLPEWRARAKLYVEGSKLRVEGSKLWAEAVIERFGPRMTIEWTDDGCRLGNGEVYRDDD